MCDRQIHVDVKHPRYSKGRWITSVPVDCGKCPPCKKLIGSQWAFRLKMEDRVSRSSFFITLTYSPKYVPISPNGLLTLQKKDVTDFIKRLRKLEGHTDLRYYAVGEYGSKTNRPHYHIIMFNVENKENIYKAWKKNKEPIGSIDIGDVKSESIKYTLKYISKKGKIPMWNGDDRIKEFSNKSKRLGSNYVVKHWETKKKPHLVKKNNKIYTQYRTEYIPHLKQSIINYHLDDLSRYYVKDGKYKIKMPKYYANLIYEDHHIIDISVEMDTRVTRLENLERKRIQKHYGDKISYELYTSLQALGRYDKEKKQDSKEKL